MKADQSVDDYIDKLPDDTRAILKKVRTTIRDAAPKASEKISYGIPTFTLNGNLVHYAAFKKHIGFYPTSSGIKKFKHELSSYKGAKGSVQFPLNKPIPFGLISKIVAFRVQESLQKVKIQATKLG
jgi:uncharacterized protein YdhG (YjbR/CyaY superfamily)